MLYAEGKKARGKGEGESVRRRGELVQVSEEVEGNRLRAWAERLARRRSLHSDAMGADSVTNTWKNLRKCLPKSLERICGVRGLDHLSLTAF